MQPGVQSCYRHRERATNIACQRCRRPICPACMVPAPVGVQCPECVREGHRVTRTGLGPLGGRRSANPLVTSMVLIGLNVAVFVFLLLTGGDDSPWADVLAISPLGTCLAGPGQYYPDVPDAVTCAQLSQATGWVAGVGAGAWWQVLTSAFAHTDPLHLGSNLLSLFFLGPPVERVLGRARFLAVYLIGALGGSAAVMWLADPASSALGASGAIFALLGSLLLLARRFGGNYQLIGGLLVLNIVITVANTAEISWQGHLGGLLAGLAAAGVLLAAPRGEHRAGWQWAGLAALTLLLLAAVGSRAIMLG
ncbi:rhomboid family intramembrane serine protease [Micropruina sonneratiae]|uniref:rhomboid family intramembrane serine protease n=1 Tax=Micropruina sonneratiae TaxID=2986940 RepID=UPI00222779A2|nr:rhomboid family intramembrane serine protease [Micropruina sp. KQZ13P-5]MCW3156565.1 rhomboid family intramembrane serine protease [Micropruina sp. KQZ13P-5]